MKKFNFKDGFNIRKNTKIKVGILIFVCVILGVSIFSISRSLTEEEQVEVKSVEVKSDGWDSNEPGAWKVTKSAEWTGFNKARITMDLETIPKYISEEKNYDIVLLLGLSTSMIGEKLESLKEGLYKYTHEVLSNTENRVAMLGHQGDFRIISDFTSDEIFLREKIDNLTLGCYRAGHCSDYSNALKGVDKILENYKPSEDRELIVLFVVDRNPDKNYGMIRSEYSKLKNKYPNIVINGIQYEMGKNKNQYLTISSDSQSDAYMHDVYEKFLVATYKDSLEKYETLEIMSSMSDNFHIKSFEDIDTNFGNFEFDEINQSVNWNLGKDFYTGNRARITADVITQNQATDYNGFYPTNRELKIKSKLFNEDEDIKNSNITPILKNYYTLTYDFNAPAGCELGENNSETHFVYETVVKSKQKPMCEGYVFRGWQIIEDETFPDVKKISNDAFLMPERNLVLRIEWGSLDIKKSVDGELASIPRLYDMVASESVPDNISSKFVSSEDGIDFFERSSEVNGRGVYLYNETEENEYPVYYYRGYVINNNVLFANYCWKIVRTTETGGTKLIFNGLPNASNPNGICNNSGSAVLIGTSWWNSSKNLIEHSSYMPFGSSSTVKTIVDSWYSNNLKNNFSNYLEDTVWCEEKADNPYTQISNGITYTYYGASQLRLFYANSDIFGQKPSISCPKKEDSFTLKGGGYPNGNELLDYPIALLTTDEFFLAGVDTNTNSYNYDTYLSGGVQVWTMSYGYYYLSAASKTTINNGIVNGNNLTHRSGYGVRPAISLKHDTKVISGDGTVAAPYIVK